MRKLSPRALNTCRHSEKYKEKNDINRMRNRSRNNCIFPTCPLNNLFISRLIASYDKWGELLLERIPLHNDLLSKRRDRDTI